MSRPRCERHTFSFPHKLEGEVARKLCSLVPHTDMWKFGKNGTDATVMAVRAARAFTGRMKILSALVITAVQMSI
jgi:glutamate-1-semialdehyde 2,1-aminomutase